MKVTVEQTEKLFSEGDVKFNSLVFSFLVTHLKKMHAKSPAVNSLENCTAAINTFLEKYTDSMAADYEIFAKL